MPAAALTDTSIIPLGRAGSQVKDYGHEGHHLELKEEKIMQRILTVTAMMFFAVMAIIIPYLYSELRKTRYV